MSCWLRSTLLLPLGLWAASVGRAADASGDRLAGLPPDLAALLATPRWSFNATLDTAVGYKDNLLLSHAAEERSAFARYSTELFLLRLPHGPLDYSVLVHAEDTRYFSGVALDHESALFAQTQWRYRVGEQLQFSGDLVGYYLDEVRDVSDTDVQRVVAEIEVNGISAGPTLRWTPRSWGWLEVQSLSKRERFRDGVYDAKLAEAAFRAGWKPVGRLEFTASAMERRRRYDRREQYTVGGRPIEDTRLGITERETEGRVSFAWGARQRLHTVLRVSAVDFADNGTGYFDYRQRKVAPAMMWRTPQWDLELELSAARIDYKTQVVGFGIRPPPRIAEEYTADFRAERKLSARWSAYVAFRWERSRSNDPLASYRVNEGLLGARWSWEK